MAGFMNATCWWGVVVGGIAIASGCNSAPAIPEQPEPPVSVVAVDVSDLPIHGVSNDGSFTVAFATAPFPVPLNEPFSIEVVVCRGEGFEALATDVTLRADAGMPQHRHGMNVVPEVTSLGPGRFRVDGMVFHMPGDWELYFDITDGPSTERTQFEVVLE